MRRGYRNRWAKTVADFGLGGKVDWICTAEATIPRGAREGCARDQRLVVVQRIQHLLLESRTRVKSPRRCPCRCTQGSLPCQCRRPTGCWKHPGAAARRSLHQLAQRGSHAARQAVGAHVEAAQAAVLQQLRPEQEAVARGGSQAGEQAAQRTAWKRAWPPWSPMAFRRKFRVVKRQAGLASDTASARAPTAATCAEWRGTMSNGRYCVVAGIPAPGCRSVSASRGSPGSAANCPARAHP